MQPPPKPGDLIQIFRFLYQHWAVYIGDGYVVHLARHRGGAKSIMSLLRHKAVVRKDKLSDVVGNNRPKINNLLDEDVEPRPAHDIVQDANSRLNQVLPYSLSRKNCEHFATELRYGKAQSRQVSRAVKAVLCATSVAVLGPVPAVTVGITKRLFKSKKRKPNQSNAK